MKYILIVLLMHGHSDIKSMAKEFSNEKDCYIAMDYVTKEGKKEEKSLKEDGYKIKKYCVPNY